MKAVVCREYGPPSLLRVEEVPDPDPEPGAGEVVIDVRAASLNFPDVLIVQNRYQLKPELPFSPGSEAAGIVSTDARRVLPMPSGMDFVTAAAFPLVFGTADHALIDRAALQPRETLLVLGASGGAGFAAIDVGTAIGARVIAGASTEARRRLRELAPGGGDVVFDPVGGRYTEPALRSCAWRGRFLVVGFASSEIPRVPLNLALLKGCSIVGVFWGDFVRREPDAFARSMARLHRWYAEGRLKVSVSQTVKLDEAPRALEMMAARQIVGKVVLVP